MAVAEKAFSGAVKLLDELSGIKISATEAKRIADEEGERIKAMQDENERRWLMPPTNEQALPAELESETLVIEADAATVLTVKGEEHKSVYCAVAFDLKDRGTKEDSGRPFIVEKRHAASSQSLEDFQPRVRALALRMGIAQANQVIFLGDGAPGLWSTAEKVLPPGTVFIQDFWHVCEHLAKVANNLYGQESDLAKSTLAKWRESLRQSKFDDIILDLDVEFKKRRGTNREMLRQEINYLKNGRSRMDYAAFSAKGWPIGSGAVEGTCKHLIKERFCVTGAHWRRAKIHTMLALRLALANDEWSACWESPSAA